MDKRTRGPMRLAPSAIVILYFLIIAAHLVLAGRANRRIGHKKTSNKK